MRAFSFFGVVIWLAVYFAVDWALQKLDQDEGGSIGLYYYPAWIIPFIPFTGDFTKEGSIKAALTPLLIAAIEFIPIHYLVTYIVRMI